MRESAELEPLLPPPPDPMPEPILTLDDLPPPASLVQAKWQPPEDIRTESGLHRAVEEALLADEHGTAKVMPALEVKESAAEETSREETSRESQTPTLAIPPLDGGTVSGSIETANTEAVESDAKPEPVHAKFDVEDVASDAKPEPIESDANREPIESDAKPEPIATAPTVASRTPTEEAAPLPPLDALAETMERPQVDASAATHDAIPEQRDRIAAERGLPPIAEPYVRDPGTPSRKWLYASLGVTAACLVITGSVVMWARGEVARARTANAAQSHELVAMRVVEEEPGDPEVAGVALEAKVVESSECSVHVAASVKAATVWIDGKARGAAPAIVPVACGQPTTVEVRHPRYENFKHTVTPEGGPLEIDARLEREKTKLTVWSEPAGAMVTYNGEVIGKTPLVTTINRYEHGTLWFHHADMASDWRKIVPKEGAKTVSISLKPRS